MITLKLPTFTALSVVLALGFAACGSSSGSGMGGMTGSQGGSHGGTTGSQGGTTGSQGGSTGSQGGSTGSQGGSTGTTCNLPPCLSSLSACIPSGTCVEQTTGDPLSGGTDNSCYSNGVKDSLVTSIDLTSGTVMLTLTVSKSGTTCFVENGALTSSGGGTFTIKNSSGQTIATETFDANGNGTIMCGGQSYPASQFEGCMASAMGSNSDCSPGSCP